MVLNVRQFHGALFLAMTQRNMTVAQRAMPWHNATCFRMQQQVVSCHGTKSDVMQCHGASFSCCSTKSIDAA